MDVDYSAFVTTPLKGRFDVLLKWPFIGYFMLDQVILGQVIALQGWAIGPVVLVKVLVLNPNSFSKFGTMVIYSLIPLPSWVCNTIRKDNFKDLIEQRQVQLILLQIDDY